MYINQTFVIVLALFLLINYLGRAWFSKFSTCTIGNFSYVFTDRIKKVANIHSTLAAYLLLATNCFLSETRRTPHRRRQVRIHLFRSLLRLHPTRAIGPHHGLKPTKFNHRQGLVLFSSHRGGTKIVLLAFPALALAFLVHSGFLTHILLWRHFVQLLCFGLALCFLLSRGDDPTGSSPLDRLRTYAEERIQVAVERVDPLGVRLQVEPIHLDHVPFVAHAGVAEGDLREGIWRLLVRNLTNVRGYDEATWSWNVSGRINSIGSRWEWNASTTVKGTLRMCSESVGKVH